MAPYKQGQNSSKMSLIQKISTNFRIIIQKNNIIFWISEYFHYLCRRLAALGNLKAPNFITSLRVAMGTAISVLFFTETFGTKYGMGYFIMDSWLRVNYLDMYAGTYQWRSPLECRAASAHPRLAV